MAEMSRSRNFELKHLLAGGTRKSLGAAEELVTPATTNPQMFAELIELCFQPELTVAVRAAYVVDHASRANQDLLTPHRSVILRDFVGHEAWEVRQVLCLLLPRLDLRGQTVTRAFAIAEQLLEDTSTFVRVFAMQALVDLSLTRPARQKSTTELVKHALEDPSPAIRARARKLLKVVE